jgi:hypothetical protein
MTPILELQVAQKVDTLLWEKIQALDLRRVYQRLIVKERFSAKDATAAVAGYREYLYQTTAAEHLSPSHDVDMAWHAHMLHLPTYFRDCMNLFNRILWHVPTQISDDEVEIALLTPRRKKSKKAKNEKATCDDSEVCDFESCRKGYVPVFSDCDAQCPPSATKTAYSIWVPNDEYGGEVEFSVN